MFAAAVAPLFTASETAMGSSNVVTVRVAPITVTAGNAVVVAAAVRPVGRTCAARVGRAGATARRLATKRAVRGTVTWRVTVPRDAASGTWVARVACVGAGSDLTPFTVKALPPPPPSIIPARVVVAKAGIASRASSIGSTFAGYGVVLQNVSPDEDALDVEVVVNILDATGLILKSESQRYAGIPAGATYFAGGESIFRGAATRIDVRVQVGARQKKSIGGLPPVSNVRVEEGFLGASVLGEFSNPYTRTLSSLARITFVCFDGAGNVVGGGYGYPETALPPGGRLAFDQSIEGLSAGQISSVQVSVEPEVD